MLRFSLLVLIFVVSGVVLAAEESTEFKVLMDGQVLGMSQGGVEGVSIEVKANEIWGFADKTLLERAEKKEGAYPKATVTGSATSGPDGKFKIDVRVTLKGSRIPKVKWGNPPVETCYVHAIFTASKAGYVTRVNPLMVTPIEPVNNVYFSQFVKTVSISGRAVSRSQTPLADVPLYLASEADYLIRAYRKPPLEPLPQTKTGKDGYFKFEGLDPISATGRTIIPDMENLAVNPTSTQWSGIELKDGTGELKLGDVDFWPAGSIKVTLCDPKGVKVPAGARLELVEPRYGRFLTLPSFVETGVYEFKRLPEGKYIVQANGPEESALTISDIEVKGGQVTDLGAKTLNPPCDLTIKLEPPAGTKIREVHFRILKIDGQWPGPTRSRDEFTEFPCLDEGTQSGQDTYTFQRLPIGQYQIWVRSYEFGNMSQLFQLSQRKETVVVKLIACEPAKLSMIGPDGMGVKGGIILMHESSPAYALFQETKGDSPKLAYNFLRDKGHWIVEKAWSDPNSSFGNQLLLRPGKYTVLAFPEQLGRIVKTDFVVEAGKQVELRLEVKPALLKFTFTQSGKPYAENFVYLVHRDSLQFEEDLAGERPESRRAFPTYTAKTDKKGEAAFDKMAAGEYVALNLSEFRYVSACSNCLRADEFSESLPKRYFKVESGENRQKCEFPAYKGTWLSISITWGSNSDFKGASLIPSAPGGRVVRCTGGFEANFGLVAKGKYECVIDGDSFRGRAALAQKIEVTKSGEQQIKIAPAWRHLTTKINGADFDDSTDAVFVIRAAGANSNSLYATMQKSPVNWSQVEVAPGDYVLTCCWTNKNKEICTVVEKVRVAGKDITLEVKPASACGAIGLSFESDDDRGFRDFSKARFRILNAAGAEVVLADPGLSQVVYNKIFGVPPGTYALEFDVDGYEPLRLQQVTVKAGEATKTTAKLLALKECSFTFSTEETTVIALRSAQITAYDAENNTVQLPRKSRVGSSDPDTGILLSIESIPRRVKKISIKVPGFKEVLVNLEGATTSRPVALQRE